MDLAVLDLQLEHRVHRCRAPLGRASGVEDPYAFGPLDLRHVRVTVDDGGAAGEARREPPLPSDARPRNVHHPDPRATRLDDELLWQRFAQRRLVHVPEDSLDAPELAKVVQHGRRDNVPRVQDQVRALQPAQALVRDAPRPSRQMGVGDDRDANQRTVNGSLISVAERSGFIVAVKRIAVT